MAAARDQDKIGWHNFLEGRISTLWRKLQHKHLRAEGSRRSSRRWASSLVANLLEITHSTWTARNDIVHEKAANGLRLAEAAQLEADIRSEFEVGDDNLDDDDKWLLELGLDTVLEMHGHEQHNWLQELRLARQEQAQDQHSDYEPMDDDTT